MFWRIPNFSASSPVESILDKEGFTLEELLDEEEIIQECKALNTRLINFLRDRAQVEQLLRYIVEDGPTGAESKRNFKFPFIACEIFTCEIDVILKTLVEDEQLMELLFSFLEPNSTHNSLLAGYFSKVVVCLMMRKTSSLMKYVQTHESIFHQLIDLIGITSIMEILVRLVGADDHMYPNFMDVMQWLADNNLLEMIIDKLCPSSPPEVHANAAEVLWAIIRNAPSPLATKLTSPSFVSRIFSQALEDSLSKSALIHLLSVCISMLDPKRSASTSVIYSIRSQHLYEPSTAVDPQIISAMLPKLGDLLGFLNISSDLNTLPTTYGELRPPLGQHRLKIVEFISVLLGTGDVTAEQDLISFDAIQRTLDLFFEYPFNNFLHHHVERIILSCLNTKNIAIVDHLFRDCNLIGRLLQVDQNPVLSGDPNLTTLPTVGRKSLRVGYIGHITRIANRLVQLGNSSDHIRTYLQENAEWTAWQNNVLYERNTVENIYRWACGRPTALQERTRDSDDDELNDNDVTELANNLSQAFRYNVYGNDDADEDVYFDNESTEVVVSSLRLGDDNNSLFTNSNWFAFQEEETGEEPPSTSTLELNRMEDVNLNCISGDSDDDDEVVVGEDNSGEASASDDSGAFHFETGGKDEDLFNDQQLPDWVGWREPSDIHVDGPTGGASAPSDPGFITHAVGISVNVENGDRASARESEGEPRLFEEDAEFVGEDLVGNERSPELRVDMEGFTPGENGSGILEFCDKGNKWMVKPEVGVVQE